MEEKIFNAALAGLLHDIGKVVQRSMSDPWRAAGGTEDDRQPVHASWSLDFAQHHVYKSYQRPALAGAFHHRPKHNPGAEQLLSYIIGAADHLSAGERSDSDENPKKEEFPRQMLNIFNQVWLNTPPGSKKSYLPLSPLSLSEEAIYPTQSAMSDAETVRAYEQLLIEIKSITEDACSDQQTYLERVLSVSNTHTWCVPSAFYYSQPDVSLYDHSRMTSALAVCIQELPEETTKALFEATRYINNAKASASDKALLEKPIAMLIGGDISGVQDFIYTISSTHAAKMLRGRSFYLQLLTEAILRFILGELGIPYTNVIYSGGGHFYLLAPMSAEKKLEEIRKTVSNRLLKHHGSSIYLAINGVPVPASNFCIGKFIESWTLMHSHLRRAKQQRYTELNDQMHAMVFAPNPHGGNQEKVCSVCGEEKEHTRKEDEEGEAKRVCPLCDSFDEKIGAKLPQIDKLALGFGQPVECPAGTVSESLAEFGMALQWIRRGDKTPLDFSNELVKAERIVIWELGDPQARQEIIIKNDLPFVITRRYTVNQVPRMDFNELAEKDKGGLNRLGVLRLDVDNLGELFQTGFKDPSGKLKNRITLARLSTLSGQLSLYFEGWVKKICQENPDVYAVYTGGDDVFLIAPWKQVPDLAFRIRDDFARYTANNLDVHLSGGMTFISGKYPVYQAAADAGDALDKAKLEGGKDAFTFLDTPWKWSAFEEIRKKQAQLVDLVDKKGGPNAILQVLQRLAEMQKQKKGRSGEKPTWGPWMWKGTYQLTRMAKQSKGALGDEILQILKTGSFFTDLDQWGCAARWAQLQIREKPNKDSSIK